MNKNLVLVSVLWGCVLVAGCGSSDDGYGKPGDSTLPEATSFDSAPVQQSLPDRKAK